MASILVMWLLVDECEHLRSQSSLAAEYLYVSIQKAQKEREFIARVQGPLELVTAIPKHDHQADYIDATIGLILLDQKALIRDALNQLNSWNVEAVQYDE